MAISDQLWEDDARSEVLDGKHPIVEHEEKIVYYTEPIASITTGEP